MSAFSAAAPATRQSARVSVPPEAVIVKESVIR